MERKEKKKEEKNKRREEAVEVERSHITKALVYCLISLTVTELKSGKLQLRKTRGRKDVR